MKHITGGNFFSHISTKNHLIIIAHSSTNEQMVFINSIDDTSIVGSFDCVSDPNLALDLAVVDGFGIFYYKDGVLLTQINSIISLPDFNKSIKLLLSSNR